MSAALDPDLADDFELVATKPPPRGPPDSNVFARLMGAAKGKRAAAGTDAPDACVADKRSAEQPAEPRGSSAAHSSATESTRVQPVPALPREAGTQGSSGEALAHTPTPADETRRRTRKAGGGSTPSQPAARGTRAGDGFTTGRRQPGGSKASKLDAADTPGSRARAAAPADAATMPAAHAPAAAQAGVEPAPRAVEVIELDGECTDPRPAPAAPKPAPPGPKPFFFMTPAERKQAALTKQRDEDAAKEAAREAERARRAREAQAVDTALVAGEARPPAPIFASAAARAAGARACPHEAAGSAKLPAAAAARRGADGSDGGAHAESRAGVCDAWPLHEDEVDDFVRLAAEESKLLDGPSVRARAHEWPAHADVWQFGPLRAQACAVRGDGAGRAGGAAALVPPPRAPRVPLPAASLRPLLLLPPRPPPSAKAGAKSGAQAAAMAGARTDRTDRTDRTERAVSEAAVAPIDLDADDGTRPGAALPEARERAAERAAALDSCTTARALPSQIVGNQEAISAVGAWLRAWRAPAGTRGAPSPLRRSPRRKAKRRGGVVHDDDDGDDDEHGGGGGGDSTRAACRGEARAAPGGSGGASGGGAEADAAGEAEAAAALEEALAACSAADDHGPTGHVSGAAELRARLCPGGPRRCADESVWDAEDSGMPSTLVLLGPSASGKSAAVHACAAELGMSVIEVSPGVVRSGKAIGRFEEAALSHELRTGGAAGAAGGSGAAGSGGAAGGSGGSGGAAGGSGGGGARAGAAGAPPASKKARQAEANDTPAARRKGLAVGGAAAAGASGGGKARAGRSAAQPPPASAAQGVSVLLIDEVDLCFAEDAGFWGALRKLMEVTRCPLVLTCERVPPQLALALGRSERAAERAAERADLGGPDCLPASALRACHTLAFRSPTIAELSRALDRAARARGLRVRAPTVVLLAAAADGDARRAIRTLDLAAAAAAGAAGVGGGGGPARAARASEHDDDDDAAVRALCGMPRARPASGWEAEAAHSARPAAALPPLPRSVPPSLRDDLELLEQLLIGGARARGWGATRDGASAWLLRTIEHLAAASPPIARHLQLGADSMAAAAHEGSLPAHPPAAQSAPAAAPAGDGDAHAAAAAAARSDLAALDELSRLTAELSRACALRVPPEAACSADADDRVADAALPSPQPGGLHSAPPPPSASARPARDPVPEAAAAAVEEAQAIVSLLAVRRSAVALAELAARGCTHDGTHWCNMPCDAAAAAERAPSAAPDPAALGAAGAPDEPGATRRLAALLCARARTRRVREAMRDEAADALQLCAGGVGLLNAHSAHALRGAHGARSELAVSTVGVLRTIARLEAERKASEATRRFYHYLRRFDLDRDEIYSLKPLTAPGRALLP